jgi:pSer/pThr/pTyr-binding forkhead associated (FHA) protein
MATTPEGTPARRLAVLAIQAGPRIGEEFPVGSPRVQIGSGSQNDVVISDDSVSTSHALLEYEHGGWRLIDLDSTNGTYVEGVRLAPQVPTPVHYGSSLRFGGLRLQFRGVAQADPEAARAEYVPPAREPTLAERRPGFRMPLWLLVALVLLVLAIAVGVYSWMHPGSQPSPVTQPGVQPQVEQPAPAPQQPVQVAPPGAPVATDTLLADTLPPAPGDTVPGQPADITP